MKAFLFGSEKSFETSFSLWEGSWTGAFSRSFTACEFGRIISFIQIWTAATKHLMLELVLVFMFTSANFSGSAFGQTPSGDSLDELPSEAREQLEKQASAMAAIYLEFTELREGISAGNYAGPTAYSVYFEGNRFHRNKHAILSKQDRTKKPGKTTGWDNEDAFDGKTLYLATPNPVPGRPAVLAKYSVDDAADPDRPKRVLDFPYLDASGFYAPEWISQLGQFSSIEPLVLHHLKESDSTKFEKAGENLRVTVRVTDPHLASTREMDPEQVRKTLGRSAAPPQMVAKQVETLKKLQKMTPKRTVKFLLDPKRGYAVAEREEWTDAGQLIVRVKSEEWKHYEGAGIWLPSRCVAWYFTYPFSFEEFSDKPILTITHQLDVINFGRKNIQFALVYKEPGTLIIDRTIPEARASTNHQAVFTVAAGGQLLRKAALGASREVDHRRFYFWLLIVNILILVSIATVLYIRHARKTRER